MRASVTCPDGAMVVAVGNVSDPAVGVLNPDGFTAGRGGGRMRGDRVEIVIDAGGGTKTYEIVATRAGRRVEITTGRGTVQVSEVSRSGTPIRTAQFMASRVVALVEHPAADRAPAYGLPRIIVDGNDADEVYRAALAAYVKARAGEGPSLIECMTYRHSGHSRADPAKYRPHGELEKWKERDPLIIYRARLKQFGVADDIIAGIDADVKRRVDEATESCKAAPPPSLDLLTADVYADGGFAWRN